MYAIIYKGEPKEITTPQGVKTLQEGVLLGYTECPNDPVWEGKPYEFVEVNDIDKMPLEWKYENGQWMEV